MMTGPTANYREEKTVIIGTTYPMLAGLKQRVLEIQAMKKAFAGEIK